jgi:hypothetical protein
VAEDAKGYDMDEVRGSVSPVLTHSLTRDTLDRPGIIDETIVFCMHCSEEMDLLACASDSACSRLRAIHSLPGTEFDRGDAARGGPAAGVEPAIQRSMHL